MKRTYSLDFIKLLFTLIIVWHHLQSHLDFVVIKSGYICVEMFFIISGFFLYKNFVNKEKSALEYTTSRIKKFYTIYIIGLVMMFIISEFNFEKIPQFIVEATMLQGTGIVSSWGGNINGPCWYFSVMIISGYFIYSLLKYNKDRFIKFEAPIIIMLTYTMMNGRLEDWDKILFFYIPLWRGLAAMCIGTIIAYFVESNQFEKFKDFWRGRKVLLYIIEAICTCFIAYLIAYKTNYVMLVLLLFPIIILSTQIEFSLLNEVLNKRIFMIVNKISFAIFVMHQPFIKLFSSISTLKNNSLLLICVTYGSVIMFSIVANAIIGKLKKLPKQEKLNA